jgi:hypothetical protein
VAGASLVSRWSHSSHTVLFGPGEDLRGVQRSITSRLGPDGAVIEIGGGMWNRKRLVAAETPAANVSLRTGCLCNPGVGEVAFGLAVRVLKPLRVKVTGSLDDVLWIIGLRAAGAVRVLFGLVSTVEDWSGFSGSRNGPTVAGCRTR